LVALKLALATFELFWKKSSGELPAVGKPGEFAKMSDEELEGEMLAYLIEAGMAEEQARTMLRLGRREGETEQ